MKAKQLAIAGVIGALAALIMFIEFPIFPVVNFLKYDPSDLLCLLIFMLYGWKEAILTLFVKDILFYFIKSDLIGVFMNFVAGFAFLTSLMFFKKRFSIKHVGYLLSPLITGIVMLFLNMIIVPIYFRMSLSDVANYLKISTWTLFLAIVAFNFIKFTVDVYLGDFLFGRIEKIKIKENIIGEDEQ